MLSEREAGKDLGKVADRLDTVRTLSVRAPVRPALFVWRNRETSDPPKMHRMLTWLATQSGVLSDALAVEGMTDLLPASFDRLHHSLSELPSSDLLTRRHDVLLLSMGVDVSDFCRHRGPDLRPTPVLTLPQPPDRRACTSFKVGKTR